MNSDVAPELTIAATLVVQWCPLRRHAMWKCDFVFLVSEIITEFSAASEFITCCTATWGAWIPELLQMFISQADVDGGGGRHTVSTLLLSNLQAGTVYTWDTGESKTKKRDQSIETCGELVAANTSPLFKKTPWVCLSVHSVLLFAPLAWPVSLLVPYYCIFGWRVLCGGSSSLLFATWWRFWGLLQCSGLCCDRLAHIFWETDKGAMANLLTVAAYVLLVFSVFLCVIHAPTYITFPSHEGHIGASVKNPTTVFCCSTWASPSTLNRVGTSAGLI